jgi:hypothetical protein
MKKLIVVAAWTLLTLPFVNAQLLGPLTYKQFSDSPFDGQSFTYFHLEDFEDHLFNVPGVTGSGNVTSALGFGGSIIDSVDGDDGNPNNGSCPGCCPGCDSYFFGSGGTGITFTFNADALGSLPTHAGIVWTDGGGTITFEAFDENSNSLGTVTGNHADGSFFGTTDEDRFYGVIHSGGISRIKITNTAGGIEVDHLQYGSGTACNPSDGDTNDDGCVDDLDLSSVIFDFGSAESGANGHTDLNCDGVVDDNDLALVIFNFGSGC